jgi:hypothetical protein
MRISLRVLMLLVLASAVLLGWRVHLVKRQREAVAAIKAYGGVVQYDWEFVNDTPTPGRSPAAPGWLRRAIGDEYFQDVVQVNLVFGFERINGRRLTDDVMETVGEFPKLRYLVIHETQVTDRAMEAVGRLSELRRLAMWEAHVTDAGMAKLRGLKGLRTLHVSNGQISRKNSGLTDESLRHLANLPGLGRE